MGSVSSWLEVSAMLDAIVVWHDDAMSCDDNVAVCIVRCKSGFALDHAAEFLVVD